MASHPTAKGEVLNSDEPLKQLERIATTALARRDASAGRGLSERAKSDVQAGIPESTQRAYSSDFQQFAAWCLAQGHDPLPADGDTVTEYLSHLKHAPRKRTGTPYSPAALDRVIAAIRTVHKAAGKAVPETTAARKVIAGYRAELSTADDDEARKRAEPQRVNAAVPAILRKLLATFDRDTIRGKRDAALLLLGHAIAARGSELVSLNISSIKKDPENRGLVVTVYRKKIKKLEHVKVVYGSNPASCPVRATVALIEAMADVGRAKGPLFVRIDRHGNVAPPPTLRFDKVTRTAIEVGSKDGRMTSEAASDIIRLAANAAEVEGRWRSHSLRRGFVTAARAAGKDLVDIGRHGGWADGSKALHAYIEEDDGWDSNPLIGIGL